MRRVLEMDGVTSIRTCSDSRQVQALVEGSQFSAVTLDLSMPHISGQELLELIVPEYPDLPVIVVTAADELETAVSCMRAGAFDYIVKPVDKTRLTTSVRRAAENWEIRNENARLKQGLLSGELENPEAFDHIITSSDKMHNIFRYIEVMAPMTLPILITGETGTGKELIANAIHRVSGRKGAFVALNVAGLDDTLFSDTLFGHLPGAYTGATSKRDGMIKSAAGGTLFLDEIGDLAMGSQVKLLRLIQEREYHPLGSDRPLITDARFVLATNVDLTKAVQEDKFRSDLYYRLRSHRIHIPPLRERREDVSVLAGFFLERAYREIDAEMPRIPNSFYTKLSQREYPGNVRELEGFLYDLAVRHKEGILSPDSIDSAGPQAARAELEDNFYTSMSSLPTVEQTVELLIEEAMRRKDGNQTEAAKILGMDRTTLNRRLNREK